MAKNSLYDRDFYAWANEQAALLRAGKLSAADAPVIPSEREGSPRSHEIPPPSGRRDDKVTLLPQFHHCRA